MSAGADTGVSRIRRNTFASNLPQRPGAASAATDHPTMLFARSCCCLAIALLSVGCVEVIRDNDTDSTPVGEEWNRPSTDSTRPSCDDGAGPVVWEDFTSASGVWPAAWVTSGAGASWAEDGFGYLRTQGRGVHSRTLFAPIGDAALSARVMVESHHQTLSFGLRREDPKHASLELSLSVLPDGRARFSAHAVEPDGERRRVFTQLSDQRSNTPSYWRVYADVRGEGPAATLQAAVWPDGLPALESAPIPVEADLAPRGALSIALASEGRSELASIDELLVCPSR